MSSMSREITSYTNHAEVADDDRERENVELLTTMMGDLDPNVARQVLRRCNGNVNKAATAILEGDTGESTSWPHDSYTPPGLPELKAPRLSVIDLTADDSLDGYSRAVEASLQRQTSFGPSDRAPHPEWAVVRSDVGTSSVSHDDHNLSLAIEESLNTGYNEFAIDSYEEQPLEITVREGGRPIALRPTLPTLTYAALVMQALFAVFQVRESIACWRPSVPVDSTSITPPTSGPELILWRVVELFANMDLAQLSAIVADGVLEELKADPWSTPSEKPGKLSLQFVKKVADLICTLLQQQLEDEGYPRVRPRLFFFSYGSIETGQFSTPSTFVSEDCVVNVDTGGDDTNNDLLSQLSANLNKYHENGSNHEVILEASEVITFQLSRPQSSHPTVSSSAHSQAMQKPFRFPKALYLDQFLGENFEIANQKRLLQMEMNAKIQALTMQRDSITHFEGTDTLKDLRASLYYYQELADPKGDVERQAGIEQTAQKLKNIITTIEHELKAIENQIAKLSSESSLLFDCPELQNYKYDLRAVFMHDGVFGRRQLYSYVKQRGVWWKTVDMEVTEATEETVLTDPTGMHLGAGPYMLIYSRTLEDEESKEQMSLPWPQLLKERIEFHNREFLSSLDPAIAAKATPHSSHPGMGPPPSVS